MAIKELVRGDLFMDIECASYAGIDSFRGYSYQIKVFVLFLAKVQRNERVEYETIDDVNVRKMNVSNFDENCDGVISSGDSLKINSAIQVKRTSINDDVAKKILFNWLLLEHRGDVKKYKLYTDDCYRNSDIIFNRNMDLLFDEINKSNSQRNALVSQVKCIYGSDKNIFDNAIKEIKNKHEFVSSENIEEEISDALSEIFHKDGVVESIFFLRIQELVNFVVNGIFSSIEIRRPYVCDYLTFRKEVENICERISNEKMSLDYGNYIKSSPICINEFIDKREYCQLKHCELSPKNLINHLGYKEYYQQYRNLNLGNGKIDLLNNIENTSSENFEMVKDVLNKKAEDNPFNRLNETKEKTNSYAESDQIKNGALIYLTKDDIDKDMQISWKDEDDE